MAAHHAADPPLRIAFVGCGNIAKYHIDALPLESCVVTVVVDPLPAAREAAAAALEARTGRRPVAHASLAAALAADGGRFEAVDAMVPSSRAADGGDLHEAVAAEVFAAGKHLLLEKPIATSVAAARRMIDAHARLCPDRIFAVAENAAFWPEVVAAGNLIRDGAIGDLLTARAKFYESAYGEWAGDYAAGSWRCDASKLPSASFTFDGATHWIRPLRLWLGEVEAVVGAGGRTLDRMPGMSMSQHIFRFESGRSCIFESVLAPEAISDQPFFTIQGTRGELVLGGFAGGATLHTRAGAREVCREGWDASYAGEYAAFVDAARGDADDLGDWTPESALHDLAVIQAMFDSCDDRRWADVDYGPRDDSES